MNNILLILSFGILGSLFAQISNIIIIKSNSHSFLELLKISLMILPIQFIIGLLYSYYYSYGVSTINYANLLITNYGFGILLSICIQLFYFKKDLVITDIISVFLIILGILVYSFKFFK